MKLRKLLIMLFCVSACCMVSKTVSADLIMELSMTTGECTGAEITVEVHRTNTNFGLGALSYDLQFSEPLRLSREYSGDYGWIANDNCFDISNPADSASFAEFQSIRFDTVVSPPGEEFPGGSSDAVVEALTITLTDLKPRWIYFDLSGPSASNGLGQDLVTTLGGYINVKPNPYPDAPEQGHTLAVYVPEPSTLILIGLGGLFLRKKRR